MLFIVESSTNDINICVIADDNDALCTNTVGQPSSCEEDRLRANLIGELVQVRDGQLHLHMLQCEVCTFIEYVCMM